MKVLTTLGLVGILVAAVVLSPKSSISQLPPSTIAVPSPASTHLPKRLTITVSVSQPDDLKIKEGQQLQVGELIADKGRERTRLEAQKSQLSLALQRLKTATITAPLPPARVPAIAALPTTQYLEQEFAIQRAKVTVSQAERSIGLKRQEVAYLQGLEHLDPLIFEHEQAQLDQLQQQHEAAVREYQLAIGRLNTAQEARAHQEYEHSLDRARRVEAQNQAALEYQQQLAAYEQRLRDRDYQVSQTQLKLDEVNNAIATLAVVKAPYSGRVRRVRWTGQNPDGALGVEITLLVHSSDRHSAPLPE